MLKNTTILMTLSVSMLLNPIMANLALAEEVSASIPQQIQNTNSLSTEQKLQLIQQTKEYVDKYNLALSKMNAKIINNELFYNIGSIGSKITGWLLVIEMVQAFRGKISPANQTIAVKVAVGLLASYGILEVLERTTYSSLLINQAEKEKIQDQLNRLSKQLEQLENTLIEIDQM